MTAAHFPANRFEVDAAPLWSRRQLCLGLAGAMAAPLAVAAHARPPQRYSYFSPGTGTVNLEQRSFEPTRLRSIGERLPSDFYVLTGLSQTLAKLSAGGQVQWQLNVQAGGGAHALGAFKRRLIVGFGQEILVVHHQSGRVTQRIQLPSASGEVIGFLRVQGDVLITGDSGETCTLQFYQLSLNARGDIRCSPLGRLRSKTQYPRDALFLAPDRLAVADTFGHAVVLYERTNKWRERRRLYEYYPNMLDFRGDKLAVLSEHGNRLVQIDLRTWQRRTRIACPSPLFEDAGTKPQQIISEEPNTITGETPPRQVCSADVSGNQTLYAANGFFDNGSSEIWVADSDNHRVAVFQNGNFMGAISGVNHPIRVIPEPVVIAGKF